MERPSTQRRTASFRSSTFPSTSGEDVISSPTAKSGLAAITGDAWRSGGAGEYTAQELDEELDFLAANLTTNIGDVTGSVSLNVLSKDLDAAMAIMMDVLTKPRFQETGLPRPKTTCCRP